MDKDKISDRIRKGRRLVPFEVKYRGKKVSTLDLKGLIQFCHERNVSRSYVITKDAADFGILPLSTTEDIKALKIPAPLACYWLGRSEVESLDRQGLEG